ncbi:MAG: DUF3843 family protein [Prevotella sp.]|nr:DUF3843 family protein [Prevotella sp.]
MKPKRIRISDITQAHPLAKKAYATDSYYTKLANSLLDDFYSTNLNLEENTDNIFRYASITLACYMEDIVADSGQWRAFSDLCQLMFGFPVPIYHDSTEEYFPDEPSMMAVRYLIWHSATEMDDIWWTPGLPLLETMAHTAFQRLVNEFENAPVNEQLSQDIETMMDVADEDFYKMRIALTWLFSNCYLTRSETSELLLDKQIESTGRISGDTSLSFYQAINFCIFAYKVGPLALYPKDYLAALARVKGKNTLSDTMEAVKVFPTHAFKMKVNEDGKTIDLLSTNEKNLTIKRDEITLKDKQLSKYDGCVASFVSYHEEWRLNGVMSPFEGCAERWDELIKKDPEYKPEDHLIADADWFLRRTKGKQILFFDGQEELYHFMVSEMDFHEEWIQELSSKVENDHPVIMFIDKESKNFLNLSFEFCECIKTPDNPFYDANIACKEAIEMLWNYNSIGTSVILYLLDKGYLPDILNDSFIIQDNPIEVKEQDVRFLLRYMRKEKY